MPDLTFANNWRSSSELGGNPDSSDSSPLVGNPITDDDGDDLQKLLEHALGTSDADGNDGPAAFGAQIEALEVDNIISEYLIISYQRQLGADDVDVRVEISADTISWSGGPGIVEFLSETNHGDGKSTVRYRSAAPFSPTSVPRSFARIVAEQR